MRYESLGWLDTGALAGRGVAAQAHSLTFNPATLRASESIHTFHIGIVHTVQQCTVRPLP
jgi:hypothetical protein